MQPVLALKVNDRDNVATVFADDVRPGTVIDVRDKKGNSWSVTALEAIPYGHKLALDEIAAGEAVVKYGEELGRASRAIARGAHVHVQNLESMRGRGDL